MRLPDSSRWEDEDRKLKTQKIQKTLPWLLFQFREADDDCNNGRQNIITTACYCHHSATGRTCFILYYHHVSCHYCISSEHIFVTLLSLLCTPNLAFVLPLLTDKLLLLFTAHRKLCVFIRPRPVQSSADLGFTAILSFFSSSTLPSRWAELSHVHNWVRFENTCPNSGIYLPLKIGTPKLIFFDDFET